MELNGATALLPPSAGSHIDTSATVRHTFTPSCSKTIVVELTVLASEKTEMPFSTDPGVSNIG
jgi:hypothetical protein